MFACCKLENETPATKKFFPVIAKQLRSDMEPEFLPD